MSERRIPDRVLRRDAVLTALAFCVVLALVLAGVRREIIIGVLVLYGVVSFALIARAARRGDSTP